jgi:hypothetical protein
MPKVTVGPIAAELTDMPSEVDSSASTTDLEIEKVGDDL